MQKSKINLITQLVSGKYPNQNHTQEELQLVKIEKIASDGGYDYLIKMPIYNLTQERIDELHKEKDELTQRYEKIQKITVEKMWITELKMLEKEYKKYLVIKKNNSEEKNY